MKRRGDTEQTDHREQKEADSDSRRVRLAGIENGIGIERCEEKSNTMHETSVRWSESVHAIQIIRIIIINRCLCTLKGAFLSLERRSSVTGTSVSSHGTSFHRHDLKICESVWVCQLN